MALSKATTNNNSASQKKSDAVSNIAIKTASGSVKLGSLWYEEGNRVHKQIMDLFKNKSTEEAVEAFKKVLIIDFVELKEKSEEEVKIDFS